MNLDRKSPDPSRKRGLTVFDRRLLLPLAIFLVGFAALAVAAFVTLRDADAPAVSSIGGPFTLAGSNGRTVTEKDFTGGPTLVFFGYTHCPDVCPATLFEMSEVLRALGPDKKAAALFVTVDPERDTPAHLADYVTSFHPRLVALTGASSAIRQVALAYKVYFARSSATQGDDYTVDHTGFVYLVGKDGRYRRFLEPGTPPEKIAAAVRAELRHAD